MEAKIRNVWDRKRVVLKNVWDWAFAECVGAHPEIFPSLLLPQMAFNKTITIIKWSIRAVKNYMKASFFIKVDIVSFNPCGHISNSSQIRKGPLKSLLIWTSWLEKANLSLLLEEIKKFLWDFIQDLPTLSCAFNGIYFGIWMRNCPQAASLLQSVNG